MKRFVCELCGGSQLVKIDDAYVCSECGVVYSLEEAKKLLVDVSPNNMDSTRLDNYFELIRQASISSNWRDAESYCNKILEIDQNISKAWLIKGEASGWQSTLAHPRLVDATTCFVKAYEVASDDERSDIAEKAAAKMREICTAFANLWGDQYKRSGQREFAEGLVDKCLSPILLSCAICDDKMGVTVLDGSTKVNIAHRIGIAAGRAYVDEIVPDYSRVARFNNHSDLQEYMSRTYSAAVVMDIAASFSEDAAIASVIYDSAIAILNSLLSNAGHMILPSGKKIIADRIALLRANKRDFGSMPQKVPSFARGDLPAGESQESTCEVSAVADVAADSKTSGESEQEEAEDRDNGDAAALPDDEERELGSTPPKEPSFAGGDLPAGESQESACEVSAVADVAADSKTSGESEQEEAEDRDNGDAAATSEHTSQQDESVGTDAKTPCVEPRKPDIQIAGESESDVADAEGASIAEPDSPQSPSVDEEATREETRGHADGNAVRDIVQENQQVNSEPLTVRFGLVGRRIFPNVFDGDKRIPYDSFIKPETESTADFCKRIAEMIESDQGRPVSYIVPKAEQQQKQKKGKKKGRMGCLTIVVTIVLSSMLYQSCSGSSTSSRSSWTEISRSSSSSSANSTSTSYDRNTQKKDSSNSSKTVKQNTTSTKTTGNSDEIVNYLLNRDFVTLRMTLTEVCSDLKYLVTSNNVSEIQKRQLKLSEAKRSFESVEVPTECKTLYSYYIEACYYLDATFDSMLNYLNRTGSYKDELSNITKYANLANECMENAATETIRLEKHTTN